MLNLAFAGVVHIHTPNFVRLIKARPEAFRVKSVFDFDRARAEEIAAELGAEVVDSMTAITSDKSIAGVVVCSQTRHHEALVTPCARAKKKLFVEKPLGFAGKDAYKMAAAIERTGVIFQTGYFMRGWPQFQYARELVQKGAFGKITHVRFSNVHEGAIGGWFDTKWRWMTEPAEAGCGAFGDLGTHAIDLLVWMLGDVERVVADVDPGTARYNCDEIGEGLLRFKNGAMGSIVAGWTNLANPMVLEISGTEGHAALINGQLYLKSKHIEGADGKTPWTQLPAGKPHAFELYLDALEGKPADLVGATEAAYRSAIVDAFYESVKKGKWISPKTPATKTQSVEAPATPATE